MSKKRGLLVTKLDPPKDREAEWNNWYNNTHVKARLQMPGFSFIRRFVKVEFAPERFAAAGGGKYLALYDLTDTSALKSKPYLALRDRESALPPTSFEAITRAGKSLARGVYEEIFSTKEDYRPPATKFLFIVGHEVPRHMDREFNAWYNTEHIPAMMRVPGFVTARRFVLAKGLPPPDPKALPKYISLYDGQSDHVFEEPDLKRLGDTPWAAWIRSKYDRKLRLVYRLLNP